MKCWGIRAVAGQMDRRYIKGGSVVWALNSVTSKGGGEGMARHMLNGVEGWKRY